jgi:DNA-binding CsgD family transcriptional regulator
MNAGHKEDAPPDAMASASAEAGMILMDLSFEPVAIDQGATSILAARSRLRRRQDTIDPQPSSAVAGEIQDLMRRAEPAGPDSLKVSFLVGEFAFTGRTYLVEPQGPRPALIVLHLKRDMSEYDPLAQVSSRYHLTDRERETLRGIAMGLTNKELAQRMKIAPNTVKTFLRFVMVKLGVTRRTGIVAKLLEHIDVKRINCLLQIVLCLSLLCNSRAQTPLVSESCVPPLCVNRLDDSSKAPLPGMLRFAVRNAPAGGLITFDPRLDGRTIIVDPSSPNNHIGIDRDITIQGSRAGAVARIQRRKSRILLDGVRRETDYCTSNATP